MICRWSKGEADSKGKIGSGPTKSNNYPEEEGSANQSSPGSADLEQY